MSPADGESPVVPPAGTVGALPELLLWALLALVCTGLFALTWIAPAPEDSGGSAGGMELRFQGRYAVGVKAIFGSFGESFVENATSQLLEQVRRLGTSPTERLLLVPVLAELAGTEEARAEIDGLRQEDELPEDVARDLALLDRILSGGPSEVTEEERTGFLERREWFARLALSQGAEPEDPERRALLADAMKVAAVMIALVIGVVGVGIVGLGLLVLGVLLARQGRLRPLYRPRGDEKAPPEPGAVGSAGRLAFLETVVVFILATVGISLLSGMVSEATGSEPLALFMSFLAMPAVLWPVLRRVEGTEIRRAYGWHRGGGVWREIGWGLVGYVAGAPILLFGILVSLLLTNLVDQQPYHPLMDSVADAGPLGVLAIFLLACVYAPLVEETVFRGGFYHYLRGRLGIVGSSLLVSLTFAFIHPQGILGVPPLVALAMILAFIREWRGSLVGSVAVHAVHNGLATTVLLLMLK